MASTGYPLLVALFGTSGTLHLVRPGVFTPLIPIPLRRLDAQLVLLSGVGELLCAAGLLHPATRRGAGLASTGLLVAVLPANVQMSISLARRARRRRDTRSVLACASSVARLPLQWPLIRIGLRTAVG